MHDAEMTAFDLDDVVAVLRRATEADDPQRLEAVSDGPGATLTGMSGRRFRSLMGDLVGKMHEAHVYMEIGIYQGLTCFVVGYLNRERRVVGIDNYSQFDPGGENHRKIIDTINSNKLDNIKIYNEDFESFLEEDSENYKGRVGVFFFDASHDYRSQLLSLFHARDFLARGGIIVVDDCNYPHVRQATIDFLKFEPQFKLILEAYTGKHPNYALQPPTRRERWLGLKPARIRAAEDHMQFCRDGWWNGVNLLVHDPDDRVERLVPHVPETLRDLFHRQHGFAGCDSAGCENRLAKVAPTP